jgi:hypothetical protein
MAHLGHKVSRVEDRRKKFAKATRDSLCPKAANQ